MKLLSQLVLAGAIACGGLMIGCDDTSTTTKTERTRTTTTDDTGARTARGEVTVDTGKVKDNLSAAGDKVEDAAGRAADATKRGLEKTGDAIQNAGHKAGDAIDRNTDLTVRTRPATQPSATTETRTTTTTERPAVTPQ